MGDLARVKQERADRYESVKITAFHGDLLSFAIVFALASCPAVSVPDFLNHHAAAPPGCCPWGEAKCDEDCDSFVGCKLDRPRED